VGRESVFPCATNTGGNVGDAVLKMGVWPPGAGLQEQASNHLMLSRSKGAVVSDEEKAVDETVR
jgi:hypothetical protein